MEAKTVDELVASPTEVAERAFLELTRSVCDEGRLPSDATAVAQRAVALLDECEPSRCARLVLLLGLLAEGGSGTRATSVHEAVRSGLGAYLRLLVAAHDDPALRSSLLFLLAHLPDDRAEIVEVARSSQLDRDEFTRLECCLDRHEFPNVDHARRSGRVWPSPAAWESFQQDPVGLPPDEVAEHWDLGIQALLAYSGAKARYEIGLRED